MRGRPIVRGSERGIALVAVLLLIALLAALASALAIGAQTDVMIVRNHELAAQARSAAEAGLSHGLQLTVVRLNAWQANGFPNASAAITALLRGPDTAANDATPSDPSNADNGSLEALEKAGETELPRPPGRVAVPGMRLAFYEARVIDEDDASRGLTAADRTRVGENGAASTDANSIVIVRAIGYAAENTSVILEATLTRATLPAIVSNDNVIISGNPTIGGTHGSVHSNQSLLVSGSPTISGDATASGDYSTTGHPDVGGASGSGRPNLQIPPIDAADYRASADFILAADGTVRNQAGAVLCNASSNNKQCDGSYGWTYSPSSPGWQITGNSAVNGTFYVEGDAEVAGSPGSPGSPVQISIIATGDIHITGNPTLRPDSPELMFVTDGDLRIAGNLTMPLTIEGQIMVHEQCFIAGNPSLQGQILVENAASLSNLVTATEISGNASITYNGLVGAAGFTVSGWRQVR